MGVVRADWLKGDIGYIELVGFLPVDAAAEPIDRAMESVSGTRSLIIDLRRNGGGDPRTVSHLVSWFLPPGRPRLINQFVSREAHKLIYKTESFYSQAIERPYLGKQVVILTSGKTFSAAEEFAYDMNVMRLARTCGETTGGGANPGGGVELGSNLSVFLPSGRALNPVTKTNWEGVGVAPDISTSANGALTAALKALGVEAVGDLPDALSQKRTFTPNLAPPKLGDQTVRLLVAGLAAKKPRYDLISPHSVKDFREDAGRMEHEIRSLGSLQEVTFEKVDGFGAAGYRLRFTGGSARSLIATRLDGKVALFFFDREP